MLGMVGHWIAFCTFFGFAVQDMNVPYLLWKLGRLLSVVLLRLWHSCTLRKSVLKLPAYFEESTPTIGGFKHST